MTNKKSQQKLNDNQARNEQGKIEDVMYIIRRESRRSKIARMRKEIKQIEKQNKKQIFESLKIAKEANKIIKKIDTIIRRRNTPRPKANVDKFTKKIYNQAFYEKQKDKVKEKSRKYYNEHKKKTVREVMKPKQRLFINYDPESETEHEHNELMINDKKHRDIELDKDIDLETIECYNRNNEVIKEYMKSIEYSPISSATQSEHMAIYGKPWGNM